MMVVLGNPVMSELVMIAPCDLVKSVLVMTVLGDLVVIELCELVMSALCDLVRTVLVMSICGNLMMSELCDLVKIVLCDLARVTGRVCLVRWQLVCTCLWYCSINS